MKSYILLLQTAIFASAHAIASDPGPATVHITAEDRVLHAIDPRLFGQFMEKPSAS